MIYINKHEIRLNDKECLQSWANYEQIVRLAMNFIKECPVDTNNGLPWYLLYSCFWTDPLRPADWPDNPAGKFAWATTTLTKYYPFSGERWMVEVVRRMLDRLWEQRSKEEWTWGGLPYASAHPGTGIYFGARADGEYASEPDKMGQAGKAYLDFYKISGETMYMEIAETIACKLAGKLREGDGSHSPLPFRVNLIDGSVVEEYSAHMLPVLMLFEDLSDLGKNDFRAEQKKVWNWIEKYPLQNNVWKGHFEDIRLDPENQNRDQLSALETARYLMQKRERFSHWKEKVEGIIKWVEETLSAPEFFHAIPIHEQKFCYFVMGSHTARYASICARLGELTHDEDLSHKAELSFNWAGYMANEDGMVTVGVDRPDYYNQCWFTDGYFDYVPHFIDGMAALPHTAPDDRNCLLRSDSNVQKIDYRHDGIAYRCFDDKGSQRVKTTQKPKKILADGKCLAQVGHIGGEAGWLVKETARNWVVDIQAQARNVEILFCD